MKAGKAAEAVLKRSVIRSINQQNEKEQVSRAGVGRDAGLFGVLPKALTGGAACAVHAGTEKQAASLAVFRACNSLAAAGGTPFVLTAQFVLPESRKESDLKEMTGELLTACKKTGAVPVQGHTEISSAVTAPVVSVTVLGEVSKTSVQQKKEEQSPLQGLELVMTKYAALSGTALLAGAYRELLHTRYTYSLIDKAMALYELVSVQPEAELLHRLGVTVMHDVAEGGVFGAVWELAEREGVGLELNLGAIPMRQETVEICEFFDINPYQVKGDGALLFLTSESARMLSILKEHGISAAVIGRITERQDRIVKNGEEVRFLEPNRVDEYEYVESRLRPAAETE